MHAAIHAALAKHFERNPPALPAGVYEIDETVTLHVKGTVRKGADSDYAPTASIPLLTTLALVLEKSGFMREHTKRLLVEAMTEALTAPEEASGAIAERMRDIEEAMTHVREVTAALPKKTRAGSTRVDVMVGEILLTPSAEAA